MTSKEVEKNKRGYVLSGLPFNLYLVFFNKLRFCPTHSMAHFAYNSFSVIDTLCNLDIFFDTLTTQRNLFSFCKALLKFKNNVR